MQVRSKAFRHFISMCRSLRKFKLMSPHDRSAQAETSPALVFAATVLALFLTILEVDAYQAELHLVGLLNNNDAINPIFFGP